jgi:hypothetical protein
VAKKPFLKFSLSLVIHGSIIIQLAKSYVGEGTTKGSPTCRTPKIEGVGGPCPYCKEDCMDFDISLKYDEISGVEPAKWELKE